MELSLACHKPVSQLLLELGSPAHRAGFKYLCIAFSIFSKENPQFFTKELYPSIAKIAGIPDWRAVEHAIRQAIAAGWKRGDNSLWQLYFRGFTKAPTSKCFIATIAEYL